LHVGHGRQEALGDAIAALLESQGHQVTREFYYNDAGAQIDKLAWSVQARARGIGPGQPGWPAEGYAGEYIEDIARDFKGNLDDVDAIRPFAVRYLRAEQAADLQAFGVKFDVYYLESSLYTDGKVGAVGKALIACCKTSDKDGARSHRLGRARPGALLPRVAQSGLGLRVRRRPRPPEDRREPGVLRAVRACARVQRVRAVGRRSFHTGTRAPRSFERRARSRARAAAG